MLRGVNVKDDRGCCKGPNKKHRRLKLQQQKFSTHHPIYQKSLERRIIQFPPAPRLLTFMATEYSANWIRLLRSRHLVNFDKINDPVVPVGSNVYGHPLACSLWGRKLEGCRKEFRTSRECLCIHGQAKLLSVHVDDIKDGGSQGKFSSHAGEMAREDGPWDPTPFIDQVYLGCPQNRNN